MRTTDYGVTFDGGDWDKAILSMHGVDVMVAAVEVTQRGDCDDEEETTVRLMGKKEAAGAWAALTQEQLREIGGAMLDKVLPGLAADVREEMLDDEIEVDGSVVELYISGPEMYRSVRHWLTDETVKQREDEVGY